MDGCNRFGKKITIGDGWLKLLVLEKPQLKNE